MEKSVTQMRSFMNGLIMAVPRGAKVDTPGHRTSSQHANTQHLTNHTRALRCNKQHPGARVIVFGMQISWDSEQIYPLEMLGRNDREDITTHRNVIT